MRRAQKAEKIGKILDDLYPEQPIPLDHDDSYTLLVAVMLSAQTTDKKVNEVTPDLFARANTCLLYTSPSPRDQRGSRMPSSA